MNTTRKISALIAAVAFTVMVAINLYIAHQDYDLKSIEIGNYYVAQSFGNFRDIDQRVRESYRISQDSSTTYTQTVDGQVIMQQTKKIIYRLSPFF